MKKLKMRSFRALIPTSLLLLLIAAVLFFLSVPSLLRSMEGPMDWDDVDFSKDAEGLYVTGTLYGIYDNYCTTTKDSRVINKDYIIDADDYYYMGLRVESKKDIEKADELLDVSQDYLMGKADQTELNKVQYEVTGIITKMPAEDLTYYNKYINDLEGWTTEDKEVFLPYYLEVNKSGLMTPTVAKILAALGAVIVFIAILLPILALKGFFQRGIRKYIANSSDPDTAALRIEQFLKDTPEVDKIRYNAEFICGQYGASTNFGETRDLVWAYLHVTTNKQYFITVSKTFELMLGYKNSARHSIPMKREALVEKHIRQLSQIAPHIVTGYSESLEKLFISNMDEFLNLRYNSREDIS